MVPGEASECDGSGRGAGRAFEVVPATGGGTRPTVYLVHGLMETAYGHFGQQIQAWRRQFQLVPVDLPGHGHCPLAAKDPYMSCGVDYLSSVLRRFGPGHIVAASYLGCPIAVRCADRTPDLVRSLVLTGFVPDVPEQAFAQWVRSFAIVAEGSKDLQMAYERLHGPRWKDTMAMYRADVEADFSNTVETTAQRLGALPVQVLLVNGSQKSAERLAATETPRVCANVEGKVIEGAGHIPGRDQPEVFNTIVASFLERTRR